ncbi:MAG TPA: aldo/keto reductase, partial [candidate division Zixibacteria bacterium]|nr:aldo/keto reductase [candidate division Zixibacteria bacterium]
METVTGKSLGQMSRIGLGTWAIGGWLWGGSSEEESVATIREALDRGITVVDTAPVYGFGRSEEIVGKALSGYGQREKVFLSTKVGLEWYDGQKIRRNAGKKRILKEIEDSLKRLRTDYIDLYFVHWPDASTPAGETAETLNQLYTDGKIKGIGVSNYSPPQMDSFREAAPLHALQPPYNLFEREIESELLPYCRTHDMSVFGYGALCRGLLSGRMTTETRFEGD